MNFMDVALIWLSAALLSFFIFFIFTKYLVSRPNPAMKFLTLYIAKDILWAIYWLKTLDRTTENFLVLVAAYLVTSFFLFYKVIRALNRR